MNGAAPLERSLAIPQKLSIELPYGQSIPLLRLYPKELKTYAPTKTSAQMFTAALLIVATASNNLSVQELMNG